MARADKKRITKPVELKPGMKAYTIPQFCAAYNHSLDTYYRMARAGEGPMITKLGHKTLIGVDDAEAWFEARKAATTQGRVREAASAEV